MRTPSSEPDLNLEGLSEAQLALLDHLKSAGPGGITFSQFAVDAELRGVDPNAFVELIVRHLLRTCPEGDWVHPDFAE